MTTLTPALFSPSKHHTVWDVQVTARECDMSFNLNQAVGQDSFVYSTLAAYVIFLGTNIDEYSPEVQGFAKEVVKPVVENCFKEIATAHGELHNSALKRILKGFLEKIQRFPKLLDATTIQDSPVVAQLAKVINVGKFTLYKLDPMSPYRGGRVDISSHAYQQAAQILQAAGYKDAQDVIGTFFDREGHIETIEQHECAANYESVVKVHDSLEPKDVAIKPLSLKIATPQTGRLKRIFAINVEVSGLEKVREACGLPAKKPFSPILSVFSQEVQPILKGMNFLDFTKSSHNKYLQTLHELFQNATKKVGKAEEKKAEKV